MCLACTACLPGVYEDKRCAHRAGTFPWLDWTSPTCSLTKEPGQISGGLQNHKPQLCREFQRSFQNLLHPLLHCFAISSLIHPRTSFACSSTCPQWWFPVAWSTLPFPFLSPCSPCVPKWKKHRGQNLTLEEIQQTFLPGTISRNCEV